MHSTRVSYKKSVLMTVLVWGFFILHNSVSYAADKSEEETGIMDVVGILMDAKDLMDRGKTLFEPTSHDEILNSVNSIKSSIENTNSKLTVISNNLKNIEQNLKIKTSEVILTIKLSPVQDSISFLDKRYQNFLSFHNEWYTLNPDGTMNQSKWDQAMNALNSGDLKEKYKKMMATSSQTLDPDGVRNQLASMTVNLTGDTGALAAYTKLLKQQMAASGSQLTLDQAASLLTCFYLEILNWEFRGLYMVHEWQSVNVADYQTEYERYLRYCRSRFFNPQLSQLWQCLLDLSVFKADLRSLTIKRADAGKQLALIPELKNQFGTVVLSPTLVETILGRFWLLCRLLNDTTGSSNLGVNGFLFCEPRELENPSVKLMARISTTSGTPITTAMTGTERAPSTPYLQWPVSMGAKPESPLEFKIAQELSVPLFAFSTGDTTVPGSYNYLIYRNTESNAMVSGTVNFTYYSKKTLNIADEKTQESDKILYGSFVGFLDRYYVTLPWSDRMWMSHDHDRSRFDYSGLYYGENQSSAPAAWGQYAYLFKGYLSGDSYYTSLKYIKNFDTEVTTRCQFKNVGSSCDLVFAGQDQLGVKCSYVGERPSTLVFSPYYKLVTQKNSAASTVSGSSIDYNQSSTDYTYNHVSTTLTNYELKLGVSQEDSARLVYGFNTQLRQYSYDTGIAITINAKNGQDQYDWTNDTYSYKTIEIKAIPLASNTQYQGTTGFVASTSSAKTKTADNSSPDCFLLFDRTRNRYEPWELTGWPEESEWNVFGICDLDNNADNDLVLQKEGDSSIYRSSLDFDVETVSAEFSEPDVFFTLSSGQNLQGIADLNADDVRDLITAEKESGVFHFFLADQGLYTETILTSEIPITGRLLCVTDCNGDNRADLIILSTDGLTVNLYLSNTTGYDAALPIGSSTSIDVDNTDFFVTSPFNAGPEIIMVNSNSREVSRLVLPNGVDGGLQYGLTLERLFRGKQQYELSAIDDFDNDGIDDVALSYEKDGVRNLRIVLLSNERNKDKPLKIKKVIDLKNLTVPYALENPLID